MKNDKFITITVIKRTEHNYFTYLLVDIWIKLKLQI